MTAIEKLREEVKHLVDKSTNMDFLKIARSMLDTENDRFDSLSRKNRIKSSQLIKDHVKCELENKRMAENN